MHTIRQIVAFLCYNTLQGTYPALPDFGSVQPYFTLDAPAQTMLDVPALPMLNVPAPLPLLDAPAPPMLDVPARQSPTLDSPAHLAYPLCSNSPPFWNLGCITSGPSNPHDPGPSATADAKFLRLYLTEDIRSTSRLLWTPELIASGPSNPHDPGPSATVADHTLTSICHLIFSVIGPSNSNDY